MWYASLIAISESPLLGYGINDRFDAITPHLPQTFKLSFTHPHNDILAATISGGILTGIFAFLALSSPIWAWVLSNPRNSETFFLSITLTCCLFTTANLNTVFFNDVTSAWLAFATFMVWTFGRSKTQKG